MSSRPLLILEYIISILRKCPTLPKQPEPQEGLRIIDVRYNQWDECLLKIQVIGKATVFDGVPQEIAADDNMLQQFSKQDIRTIIYFATQEVKKPKYKLVVQDMQKNVSKVMFKLSQYGSPQSIEKTAEQISLDKELLHQLSPEDAHTIGYAVSAEQMLNEREEIERLKKQLPS